MRRLFSKKVKKAMVYAPVTRKYYFNYVCSHTEFF